MSATAPPPASPSTPVPGPADKVCTRPGGRSARVRDAVFRATQELAAEGGTEKVTIPVVAARAGVNPTTVYRRWGSMPALLADLAAARIVHTDVPDTGTFDGDLAAFAAIVLEELRQPGAIAVLRVEVDADLASRQASLRRCLALRDGQIEQILARVRARGGTPPVTLERINDRVVAPLYYRVLFGIPGTDAAYARGLAADLLAAAAA